MSKFGLITGLAASVSALAMGASAFAQTTPAEQEEASGLREIIVTAQRRGQNMQDVPISVTAVTAENLQEIGLSNTELLTAVVPGLSMTRQGRGGQPYIRGVGSQNTVPGNENAVATYVDGVYYADPGGSLFSFNNINRIEVLKGPQGTLFGRNATGGLVHIITREPTVAPQVRTSISYADYETVEGNAYLSGGVGNIAADIAFYGIHQGEGFGRYLNIAGNPDANRREEYALRSRVLFELSPEGSLILSGDYRTATGDYGVSRNIYPGTIMAGGFPHTGSIQDASGTTETDVPDSADWGVSAQYRHNFGDVQLSLLSAYRQNEYRMIYDQDVGPAFLSLLDQSQDTRTFQNEILLNGALGDLDWTAGVFVFHARARFDPIKLRSSIAAGNSDLYSTQTTASYAAFAQGTYPIFQDTDLTIGFRYTVDDRQFDARRLAAGANPNPAGTVIQTAYTDTQFSEPTWRIGLDHQLTEDLMIYATYNRGFKSGVYNLVNPAAPPVRPELLDAFEIGIKSELFDNRMRLNASAFYYDYQDIHLNTVQAGLTSIFNAAGGEVTGGEVELIWAPNVPFGALDITGNLSVLDATYTDFPAGPITTPNPAGGNVSSVGDLSGNAMIRSPEWTLNIGVNYTMPLSFGELGFNVNYYHNDGFYWEADNRLRQDAYDLFNLSTWVAFGEDAQYRIRFFANNLTDEEYFVGVAENSFGDTGMAGMPRIIGIGFDYKY